MKGLTTWIWMGCLCLGITQTVSTHHIIQSLFSSLSNMTNPTNSLSVPELQQRTYAIPQLFTRIVSHPDQHDRVTGYNRAANGSMKMVAMPTNETFSVGKRSVKRSEVNYFENLVNQSMPSVSLRQAFSNMSRHKRMVKKKSQATVKNEKERKQQEQQEADHRPTESAVRRKEAREEKLARIKNRRLQLMNTRKSSGMLRVRERQSISEKNKENRGKLRHDIGPQRPLSAAKDNHRSSAHNRLLNKRKSRLKEKDAHVQYGENICKKSMIEKHHKPSKNLRQKDCVPRGNKRNRYGEEHSFKGLAKKQSTGLDEESRHSKSSSEIENNSTEKKSKHSEMNSEEDDKSRVKDQDSKEKMDHKRERKKVSSNHRKSRKSKGLDKNNAVSKSSSLKTHKHAGKHGSRNIAKQGDKHKHSGKGSESERPNKNKKVHQRGQPENKKSDKKMKSQKNEKDEEEQDKENIALKKGGKVSKSKIKSTKEQTIVVSEDSEEKSNNREVHKYKQEEKEQSQGKTRKLERLEKEDSENVDGVESSSVETSPNYKVEHLEKKSKSAKMTENSTKIDKKHKPTHKKNEGENKYQKGNQIPKSNMQSAKKEVNAKRPGVENNVDEIEYLSHVLGFGLGNRKQRVRRVRKRPMTGVHASSGRLNRALANLYGASASAGF